MLVIVKNFLDCSEIAQIDGLQWFGSPKMKRMRCLFARGFRRLVLEDLLVALFFCELCILGRCVERMEEVYRVIREPVGESSLNQSMED